MVEVMAATAVPKKCMLNLQVMVNMAAMENMGQSMVRSTLSTIMTQPKLTRLFSCSSACSLDKCSSNYQCGVVSPTPPSLLCLVCSLEFTTKVLEDSVLQLKFGAEVSMLISCCFYSCQHSFLRVLSIQTGIYSKSNLDRC